jgi:hypothetical protein
MEYYCQMSITQPITDGTELSSKELGIRQKIVGQTEHLNNPTAMTYLGGGRQKLVHA